MRTRDRIVILAAGLLPAAPAAAGIILHEVETTDSGNRQSHIEMDVGAEGDGLRVDITNSDSPFMPTGSYMLFPSEELIYMVNPGKKTYSTMDMTAMAGMQTQMQRMQQPVSGAAAPTGPENVVVQKKVDEAGPVMLGLPTQHLVYEVSYHQPPPAPGAPAFDFHGTYEIWATQALDARLAAASMLKKSASRLTHMGGGGGAGDPKEVGDAIASHGLILKQNFTKESKAIFPAFIRMSPAAMFMKGGQPRTTSSSVVTTIRDESLPPERFVLPKGYAEVEMMNPNMGAMPDLSKLPGKAEGAAQPANNPQQMPDLNNIPK